MAKIYDEMAESACYTAPASVVLAATKSPAQWPGGKVTMSVENRRLALELAVNLARSQAGQVDVVSEAGKYAAFLGNSAVEPVVSYADELAGNAIKARDAQVRRDEIIRLEAQRDFAAR